MLCQSCNGKTKVTHTFPIIVHGHAMVQRRRKCLNCKRNFVTYEEEPQKCRKQKPECLDTP